MDEEGYIYKMEITLKKVKIPEGCVKCLTCEGSGEVRVHYGPSWDRGQFACCHICSGKGYIEKELLKQFKRVGLIKG